MGFLHKLWDETLAGPAPDAGLGKLRKYNSFSASRSTAAPSMDMSGHPHGDDRPFPITRSITVVRREAPRMFSVSVGSPSTPSSTASSTPSSPFSPNSPGGNCKKWMRKKKPAAGASHSPEAAAAAAAAETESKNLNDWILIVNSLDR